MVGAGYSEGNLCLKSLASGTWARYSACGGTRVREGGRKNV
jgi:hypothetical protein